MLNLNLKGLRVLNTRPWRQGLTLHQAIINAGGVSIQLPLLDIEAKQFHNLPSLNQIQHAIFISANAVNYFFKSLKEKNISWPLNIKITTIGQATAKALEPWGMQSNHSPTIADSHHLLQLQALQDIHHQKILLIKGENGKPDIEQTLLARGAKVIPLAVYRRILPAVNPIYVRSLWQNEAVDIILLTSQQSIHNLFVLFGEEAKPWLYKTPCVVLSERLAKEARRLGIQHTYVSTYDTLIKTLQNEFAHTLG